VAHPVLAAQVSLRLGRVFLSQVSADCNFQFGVSRSSNIWGGGGSDPSTDGTVESHSCAKNAQEWGTVFRGGARVSGAYSSNMGTWRWSSLMPRRARRVAPITARTVSDSRAVRGTKMRCVFERWSGGLTR
jgi:hypothetical protein